jgi:hypothetical protein
VVDPDSNGRAWVAGPVEDGENRNALVALHESLHDPYETSRSRPGSATSFPTKIATWLRCVNFVTVGGAPGGLGSRLN